MCALYIYVCVSSWRAAFTLTLIGNPSSISGLVARALFLRTANAQTPFVMGVVVAVVFVAVVVVRFIDATTRRVRSFVVRVVLPTIQSDNERCA